MENRTIKVKDVIRMIIRDEINTESMITYAAKREDYRRAAELYDRKHAYNNLVHDLGVSWEQYFEIKREYKKEREEQANILLEEFLKATAG